MFSGLSASELIIVIISLVFSLSLHEAMHGFVAFWLGDTTASDMGRLTLNPLKHIDLITTILLPLLLIVTVGTPFFAAKPVPFNPNRVRFGEYGAALVGLAGPLTNLFLAVIASIILRLGTASLSSTIQNDLALFTLVNVCFFVFNMIPFPPLDGSRLLYAFAPEPLQEIMVRLESYGFVTILLFIFVFYEFFGGFFTGIELHLYQLLTGVN
jgi:Zn-dependent protease